MALSSEQREFRASRIGSSDAIRIMAGRWVEVWEEKTGRASPVDLDLVPAVQIGIATEPLHARFWTHRTGVGCCPAGDKTVVHPEHDFLVAHLDFLTWSAEAHAANGPPDTVLEAKFSSGFQSDEELAGRYYWQIQHQLLVSGLRHGVLSVLRPSSYSWLPVPRSEADIALLLETLKVFWWHVEADVVPADPDAVIPNDVGLAWVFDMSLHNEFVIRADALLANRESTRIYREAEEALKALMPADARCAFLPDGLYLLRARDGKVSLRFGKVPSKYHSRVRPWLPDRVEAAE